MSKQNKDALFILAFFIWIIVSAIVGISLNKLSDSSWMGSIIAIFVLLWGGVVIWGWYKVTHPSTPS